MALQITTSFDPQFSSRSGIEQDYKNEPESEVIPLHAPMWFFHPRVKTEFPNRIQCDRLYIGLPGAGAEFLDRVVPQEKHILGTLILPEMELKMTLAGATNGCALISYHDEREQKVLALICHSAIPPARSMAWTETLFDTIEAQNVLVFDESMSSQVDFECSLQQFTTSWCLKNDDDAALDSIKRGSTLIDGLSAAILTWRELHQVSARILLSAGASRNYGYTVKEQLAVFLPLLEFMALRKRSTQNPLDDDPGVVVTSASMRPHSLPLSHLYL